MNASDQERRLERLRGGATAWIASADNKAMALLTVAGALLALLAGVVAGVSPGEQEGDKSQKVQWVLFLVFCLADLVSIGAATYALKPRTNRLKILAKAGWSGALPRSRTYFGDLAKLTKVEFEALIDAKEDVSDAQDAREQAFVFQRIADMKMKALKVAVVSLGTGLVALGSMLIVAGVDML
jgi:hypothetical protein